MSKKLTLKEVIDRIVDYCRYSKQLADNEGNIVRFQVENENTYGETETERQAAGSQCAEYTAESIDCMDFLCAIICKEVANAKWNSKHFNNLNSVRVWIKTFNSEGELIDEEPINDYEINYERGVRI